MNQVPVSNGEIRGKGSRENIKNLRIIEKEVVLKYFTPGLFQKQQAECKKIEMVQNSLRPHNLRSHCLRL